MRALVRLVALVVIGFGVGLGFGVVLEEPELLAAHLLGESEPVDLASNESAAAAPGLVEGGASRPTPSAREADAALPEVAAPSAGARPPLPEPEPEPEAASARRRANDRDTEATSRPLAARPEPRIEPTPIRAVAAREASPPSPRWAIQVGAFADAEAANRLADGLKDRYPVAVLPAQERGGRWRVRIQPIAGEDEARAMADRLKRDDRLPTWVTRMEARAGR